MSDIAINPWRIDMLFSKMKTILPIVLAISCGSKSANITAPTEEGTWESDCISKSERLSIKMQSTFNNGQVEAIKWAFSDGTCNTPSLKTKNILIYKIGKDTPQVSPETRELKITGVSEFVTALSEDTVDLCNFNKINGTRGWRLNEEKEVTNLEPEFTKGTEKISSISIKDDIMHLGEEFWGVWGDIKVGPKKLQRQTTLNTKN